MGACGSKPKVRGEGEDAPARPCVPTSSTRSNLDRSSPDPPVGCSLAGNPTSLSPIPVEHPTPTPTTPAKENVEGGGGIRKADDKEKAEGNGLPENNNLQLELPKQKPIPIENFQSDLELESMKPEPVKTHVESTKPEPVKALIESKKPQIPKPALPELPSKETEIKLLDSEIKLLESAAKTLSKKAEQGGISLLPDHTPDESETKLLASLATPENNETPRKESESESKEMPELVKQESQREREKHKNASIVSDESMWNGMSCASSRQASIDFLDASDKMVIDRGVLESMSVIPDTMKAELERAVEEPITSTKSVKDWNAKMEKIESFGETKTEKESITENKYSENNKKDEKPEKEKERENENTHENVNETPKQIGVNIRYPK